MLIVPPQTTVRPPNILQKSSQALLHKSLQFLMVFGERCGCHGECLYPLRLISTSNHIMSQS